MKKFVSPVILPLLLLTGIVFISVEYFRFTGPKPGEIWEYTYYEDNPFEEPRTRRYEILAVKNGYVKYRVTSYDGKSTDYTGSCSTGWFRVGSKRISP